MRSRRETLRGEKKNDRLGRCISLTCKRFPLWAILIVWCCWVCGPLCHLDFVIFIVVGSLKISEITSSDAHTDTSVCNRWTLMLCFLFLLFAQPGACWGQVSYTKTKHSRVFSSAQPKERGVTIHVRSHGHLDEESMSYLWNIVRFKAQIAILVTLPPEEFVVCCCSSHPLLCSPLSPLPASVCCHQG